MKDRHVREKLSDYIDGMLNAEEASLVRDHLDRCPACSEEYEEMVKIIGHLNQMEQLETPQSFVEKVHKRMEKQSSLRRLVKGLFYPPKIKVPLEIAGVAAAALLVIYIVGIRGKQHVYELAYVQRSQLPAALQEKTPEEGVEVDKAITVVDEAAPLPKKAGQQFERERKPELELEEKKAEPGRGVEEEKVGKKDKRAKIAEPVAADREKGAALEHTEKSPEARAQVEDATPSSRMMTEEKAKRFDLREEKVERKEEAEAKALSPLKGQKREKPSLHIADKEKGVAQENVLAEPTLEEENVEDIVTALGGKIIESEFNENTQEMKSLVIQIQADRCRKLIQILEKRGDIQRPYPTIKEKGQEIITIRIKLQQ